MKNTDEEQGFGQFAGYDPSFICVNPVHLRLKNSSHRVDRRISDFSNSFSDLRREGEAGFRQFGAEAGGVVGPRKRDAQERPLVPGEEFVDEAVALDPVRAPVGAVVQLDAADDAAGGGIRDDEVDVFADDPVKRGLLARTLFGIEKIREPDLAGNPIGRMDERLERGEEGEFGRGEQVVRELDGIDGICRR